MWHGMGGKHRNFLTWPQEVPRCAGLGCPSLGTRAGRSQRPGSKGDSSSDCPHGALLGEGGELGWWACPLSTSVTVGETEAQGSG